MRVLLDACVPESLRHHLPGIAVETARFAGLQGLLDSRLLDALEGRFNVLITVDAGFRYQQNMQGRTIAVVVLRSRSNRLPDVLPFVPTILAALSAIGRGDVIELAAP